MCWDRSAPSYDTRNCSENDLEVPGILVRHASLVAKRLLAGVMVANTTSDSALMDAEVRRTTGQMLIGAPWYYVGRLDGTAVHIHRACEVDYLRAATPIVDASAARSTFNQLPALVSLTLETNPDPASWVQIRFGSVPRMKYSYRTFSQRSPAIKPDSASIRSTAIPDGGPPKG